MSRDALDYFSILGADETTDSHTLKILYREKAKFWHPDMNKSTNAMDMFQKLSKAYDTLQNPKTKALYSLLSLIYTGQDFPNLERLNTYKSAKGFETPYLRVFSLERIEKGKVKTDHLIGTYDDALGFIKKATTHNFLRGFFSPKFYQTLQHNLNQILSDSRENLKLLVHNAAAFYDEGKLDASYISAVSALSYASKEEQEQIRQFLTLLPSFPNISLQTFNTKKLRQIQLQPFFHLAFIVAVIILGFISFIFLSPATSSTKENEIIDYYQKVSVDGQEITDDLITSKIFNIPVDLKDSSMLYHIIQETPIMYGPSEKFDILAHAFKNQTVRITGHTPDHSWYRIMIDNGDMGFIKQKYLQKGIGLDIPLSSQITSHDR